MPRDGESIPGRQSHGEKGRHRGLIDEKDQGRRKKWRKFLLMHLRFVQKKKKIQK